MRSHLPLDDQLNRVFYVDGTLCRLVYNRVWERCVLRREPRRIEFDHAVTLIAHGEVLWVPPEEFQRLTASTPSDTVRREHALLCAFLLSPAARRITDAELRTRLLARLNDDEMWLGHGALPR
jgi:UDP-2,3-diacylglucosamine pyrophosphatase LpxH